MSRFTGLVPPILTPLTADGQIDVPSLEKLVARQIAGGVDALFALGSSGETVYLSDAQRDQVLDVVTGTAAGQVPVIAGCIETTTGRVIDRVRSAAERGADAVVATAPFYTIVGPHETERHFRLIAAASDLPLFAYDIPVCVHSKLDNGMILELAADGVLAGVKDSSNNDVAFRQLLSRAGENEATSNLIALTGHEVMVDSMLAAGASGSVPGLGNVDPAGYARLHAAARSGDWAAARAEQERLVKLFRIVEAPDADAAGTTRGVGAFKTALWVMGEFTTNNISAPSRPLNDGEAARIRAILAEAELV